MTLASDVGPAPMNVGAVLLLDGGPGPAAGDEDTAHHPEPVGETAPGDTTPGDPALVEDAVARRVATVPRFRQRLVDVPRGCGRPVWVEDGGFDPAAHLERVRCPAPGDTSALLSVAADALTRPLPRTRPLWRAVVVTDLADGRLAVVLVVHHVLADGVGGLAVLQGLVDGSPAARKAADTTPAASAAHGTVSVSSDPAPVGGDTGGPAALPPARRLLADAAAARLRALARTPRTLAALGTALGELGTGRPRTAPRCSLNAPTGPRRHLATVEVGLEEVRRAARAHGATINDALLVATTGAMREVLHRRGEDPRELVISVPVSARGSTTAGDLGNQVGVMPVRVPLDGSVPSRLRRVATETRERRRGVRGRSVLLVGPAFRLLAGMGLFRHFVDRQRLVNSFLTNLRGPEKPLYLAGLRVTGVVPVTVSAGNVAVAFAVLSYAGTLATTLITDPDLVEDVPVLREALRREFQEIVDAGRPEGLREPARRDIGRSP